MGWMVRRLGLGWLLEQLVWLGWLLGPWIPSSPPPLSSLWGRWLARSGPLLGQCADHPSPLRWPDRHLFPPRSGLPRCHGRTDYGRRAPCYLYHQWRTDRASQQFDHLWFNAPCGRYPKLCYDDPLFAWRCRFVAPIYLYAPQQHTQHDLQPRQRGECTSQHGGKLVGDRELTTQFDHLQPRFQQQRA